MNASSLFVAVSRLVFQGDLCNETNNVDLYRLIPYLRQSLSCSVCGNLLCEPFSPTDSPCQHHECKQCVGGRKNLKPSCSWCRDYKKYEENIQLRLLLQCYKRLCEYIKSSPLYDGMQHQFQANASTGNNISLNNGNGMSSGASNCLVDIIDEGIQFKDEFKSTAGLTKAAYSILPCLYTNSPATQTTQSSNKIQVSNFVAAPQTTQTNNPSLTIQSKTFHNPSVNPVINSSGPRIIQSGNLLKSNFTSNSLTSGQIILTTKHVPTQIMAPVQQQPTTTPILPKIPIPAIKTVSNGSALYSVLYAGSGNKITIKRKTDPVVHQEEVEMKNTFQPASIPKEMISQTIPQTSQEIAKDQMSQINFSSTQNLTPTNFKKPSMSRSKAMAKRKGCRCGNATPTPGKLTCCGQRCPCYVESKSCIDCKCRGCRNPHRPNGFKVRPHIPELENLDYHLSAAAEGGLKRSLDMDDNSFPTDNNYAYSTSAVATLPKAETSLNLFNSNLNSGKIQVVNVFTTTHMPQVSSTLPSIIMSGESNNSPYLQNHLPVATSTTTSPNFLNSIESNYGTSFTISQQSNSNYGAIFGDELSPGLKQITGDEDPELIDDDDEETTSDEEGPDVDIGS